MAQIIICRFVQNIIGSIIIKTYSEFDIKNIVRDLIWTSKQYKVHQLCHSILHDDRFEEWSGSSRPNQHHYGKHGLIIHTNEVIKLCFYNNTFFNCIDKKDEKLLFLAAFFHDVGKIWDYQPINKEKTEWESTQHKRKIHHISRSALTFQEACVINSGVLAQDEQDEVLHAILAHHGMREWGSPIAPKTKLAWLLHLCDGLSARLDDCETYDSNYLKK